jgi:hypothetical protein
MLADGIDAPLALASIPPLKITLEPLTLLAAHLFMATGLPTPSRSQRPYPHPAPSANDTDRSSCYVNTLAGQPPQK